jgi:DNA-binding transcriptional LysR family regulator
LEARLGFRLCDRGRGGFRLTEKGTGFVRQARQFLGAVTEFNMTIRNMDRKLVGVLILGLSDHLPVSQSAHISQAISRFRRRDQSVKFSVIVRPARDLEEQLLNGQIHVAFGYFWHRLPTIEYTQMFTENQIACCGREHPLFSRAGQVTAREAANYEWAWRSYPLPEAQLFACMHRVTAIADDMSAVAVLVMSGRHLAFLPEHFAEPYVRQKLMAPLNASVLRYDVPFQRAITRGSSRNEVLRAFLNDVELSRPLAGNAVVGGYREARKRFD